jgi:hypothetical protein
MDRWLTERGVTLIGADLDESPWSDAMEVTTAGTDRSHLFY